METFLSIDRVCRILGISRSGYYQWLKKLESKYSDGEILEKIYNYFHNHKGKYGSRRILHLLRGEGIVINRKRVQRMMRQLNLKAKGKPKFKKTTKSNHKEAISPNLVNQNFNVDAPNRLYVSDITYIPTREGWLYLMVVLDCFGRKVKTWSLRSRLTKEIVTEPVAELLKKEKPTQLMFHSDRGSQYASKALRNILQKFNVKQSMSSKGNCYDNAVAESFFKTLKYELSKKIFKTKKEAEIEIFEYIEMYYNSKRLHSSNNYKTPNQVYDEFKAA